MFKESFIYQIFCKIHKLIWPGLYKVQTFTYFIPSPPQRKTGYREKEFDTILYNFINRGYDILDFNTQASSNNGQSGMWAIITVRANKLNASNLNLNDDYFNTEEDSITTNETVEGLYQIESENEEFNNNIDY
jgi:hypothetical protein